MYKVKLNEGHTAGETQTTTDGYLQLFDTNTPIFYDESEASKMARRFKGTIEPSKFNDAVSQKVTVVKLKDLPKDVKQFITGAFRVNQVIDNELIINEIALISAVIANKGKDKPLQQDLKELSQFLIYSDTTLFLY